MECLASSHITLERLDILEALDDQSDVAEDGSVVITRSRHPRSAVRHAGSQPQGHDVISDRTLEQ